VKIYRFLDGGRVAIGVGDGERIFRYTGRDATALGQATSHSISLSMAELLPPVVPSKIVAVGRNYAEHAKELGNEAPSEPIIFLKPPSALLPPNGTIIRPPQSERVDFEGELAIVIGSTARNIAAADWRSVVLGFTCANDVTARDLQKKDVQFTRGKSFDTFCPLGPCIETDLDRSALSLRTRVNGETKQNGNTRDMVFDCGAIIEFITSVMTLNPGDVILTGTPAGVGPLVAGDRVEVEIEGIGVLANVVA
jgi:2-keto-4-pentenoate hydratase/2-oxohepta-3-ene-1,7-dioic acid hydratase in catechol pathway